MPLDFVAEGLLGGIARFLGWVLIEIIGEVLIKGLGYLLLKPLYKTDPDGLVCVVVGLLGWCLISFTLYWCADTFFTHVEIDRCLDAGGKYNYETSGCEN